MLSSRLKRCMDFVDSKGTLLDIGCDHGFASIYAIKHQKAKKAIASDINQGPLLQAEKNIQKAGLTDKIETRLQDGIGELTSDIDTILIAGMGGILISSIINTSPLFLGRFILEPNTDSYYVRESLEKKGFLIIDEDIIFEKGHYYEIIVAEKGEAKYSELELFFGPILLKKQPIAFLNRNQLWLEKLLSIKSDDSNLSLMKERLLSIKK